MREPKEAMAQPQSLVAECPTCKAVVPMDATECPQCGELFEMETVAPEPVRDEPVESAEPGDEEADEEASESKSGFREKFLFYTGIFLILIVGIVFLILSLRFSRPSDVEKDLNALRGS